MRPLLPLVLPLGLACWMAAGCGKDATGPVPTQVFKVAGDSQAGFPGDALPAPLRVRVTSTSGQPVSGVSIRWSSSNATLSATHSVTDADGMASITAVLALTPAHGAIQALAGSEPNLIGFVEFWVEIKNPCEYPVPLTIGTTVTGTITNRDCVLGDGSYLDAYSFTAPSVGRFRFAMTSTAVDAFLFVLGSGSIVLGGNDSADATTANAALDIVLPAGDSYGVWANTAFGGDFGDYQLSGAALPADISDCVTTWIVTTTTGQTLPAAGCRTPDAGTLIADHFAVVVSAGNHVSVSMTAATFAAQVRIFAARSVVGNGTAAGPGQTATATYDVPWNGTLVMQCSDAAGGNAGGAYTLSVIEPRAAARMDAIAKAASLSMAPR